MNLLYKNKKLNLCLLPITILIACTLLTFFPPRAIAQNISSQKESEDAATDKGALKLTNNLLTQKLGAGWKGIIFICEPYCRFLSLKEKDVWTPPLPSIKFDFGNLKTIAQSDPLYPIFVKTYANGVGERTEGTSKTNRNDEQDGIQTPPDYAKGKFDLGFNFHFGIEQGRYTSSSDSQIQSNLSKSLATMAPHFRFAFMKGQPISYFNQYWQPTFEYQSQSSASASTGATNEKIQFSGSTLRFGSYIMKSKYRPYVGLELKTQKMQTANDSLSQFSTATNRKILNLGVAVQRLYFELNYSLSSEFKDNQGYRSPPFQETQMGAKLHYGSKNLELFDFTYGLHLELAYATSTQQSGVNSQILSIDKSKIQQSQLNVLALIRFGEDFLQ